VSLKSPKIEGFTEAQAFA